jgi:fatty-acyl-CoA synthase
MILSDPAAQSMDFRGWKINTGGMALPRGLAKRVMDAGIDIFHGYGMSETCPILTLANLKPHMMEWGTEEQLDYRTKTGFPLPLVDMKLLDERGRTVPCDGKTQGEITVRTPWCTTGYHKSREASEELWQGGRLHTGDIAVMDPEGYVLIADRIKDVIKTGGEWVSSLTLESLLSQHAAVSEVAVVGKAHEKWGERPIALIVLRDGCEPPTHEDFARFLLAFVEQGVISKWAMPDEYRFVDQIPRTSVGKINKMRIRSEI